MNVKKQIFLIFVLSLLSLVGYGVGRLYFKLTDGFCIANIQSNIPYDHAWEIKQLTHIEKQELADALGQPYHYLDKGHQAYVFESQDKKYVIKFLKFQRLLLPRWYLAMPLPTFLDQKRQKKIKFKKDMLEKLLLSWKLSFNELKEEAGIVYCHVNATQNLLPSIKITDKIGLRHTILLDNYVFLVQRKADLLKPAINQVIGQGQDEKAKKILSELINLLVSEYKRGLAEKEIHMLRNTGVYMNKPVHIDNGRFEWDPELKDPKKYANELFRKTIEVRNWLSNEHPHLSTYFEKLLEKIKEGAYHEIH